MTSGNHSRTESCPTCDAEYTRVYELERALGPGLDAWGVIGWTDEDRGCEHELPDPTHDDMLTVAEAFVEDGMEEARDRFFERGGFGWL